MGKIKGELEKFLEKIEQANKCGLEATEEDIRMYNRLLKELDDELDSIEELEEN